MRLKDISPKTLPNPCFLLTRNPDHLTRRLVRERIQQALKGEVRRISLRSIDPGEIFEIIQTGDLFSSRNIYIVEDLDAVKMKQWSEMISALETQKSEDRIIFMVEDSKRIPDQARKSRNFIELKVDPEQDIVPVLRSYLQNSGFDIDRSIIDYMINIYQDDLGALEREIEKIRYYFWGEESISLERIQSVLADSPEVNAVNYSRCLLKGDKKEALIHLKKIENWEVNFQLVLGTITGFLLRNLEKNYSTASSIRKLNQLARLDFFVKSKSQLPWRHLEFFTINS
ncbi:MAG TPA: hypothetical protein EYP24_01345 [bacterium (Candidatus Stahlbacteria)]|nr:hypothetical protein [Candidatus Stahlbacteria bacterium]